MRTLYSWSLHPYAVVCPFATCRCSFLTFVMEYESSRADPGRDWALFCSDEPCDGFRVWLFLLFWIEPPGSCLYTPFAADMDAFLSNLPSGLEGLRQGNG